MWLRRRRERISQTRGDNERKVGEHIPAGEASTPRFLPLKIYISVREKVTGLCGRRSSEHGGEGGKRAGRAGSREAEPLGISRRNQPRKGRECAGLSVCVCVRARAEQPPGSCVFLCRGNMLLLLRWLLASRCQTVPGSHERWTQPLAASSLGGP